MIALNPQYAYDAYGQTVARYIPSGRWSVRVAPNGRGWAAVAFPLGHDGDPFTIASGPNRSEVESVARRWADCATTAVMQYGRIRYVGVEAPARVLAVAS